MKTRESIEELHELVNDQGRQLDELHRQIQELRVNLNVKPKNRSVLLAEELKDKMLQDKSQAFIEGRDLFSIHDMLMVAEYYIKQEGLTAHGVYGDENTRKRLLSRKLVESGLFRRMVGQEHIPGEAGIVKPSNRKHKVIVSGRFKKYEAMTQNHLYNELRKQEDKAIAAVEERSKAEVAKEVSFL